MLASLYSFFGNTEKYDNKTATFIGILLFLIGLIITFTIYAIYLVDETQDRYPERKAEFLRTVIVVGFTISLISSLIVGFSIDRYYFCKTNRDICILDYSFSPFA
jgi:phosphoglycerol transferase MdoB-like AlkP superfamily enzyme